jgi:preprotein translocase subunit SecA
MSFLEKIFGSKDERVVKKLEDIANAVLKLEDKFKGLTDKQLKDMTLSFKTDLSNGKTIDDIMIEAFALVREAAFRTLGMKHFGVQIIGGAILHEGRIAEMKTGEGKTLVATLPVYLNALSGEGVHVVTANEYLAKRDREWMGKIYEFLGLTVGVLTHDVNGQARKEAYKADITFGTNSEFGFDYLRDNMAIYKEEKVQRGLNYAIVDEVDSILIDEARTPLIISGSGNKTTDLYYVADRFAKALKAEVDFLIDEKQRSIVLTDDSGVEKAEKYFNVENLSDPQNLEINHHINNALRARFIMKSDVDYIVSDGEIVIVDDFTGRLMHGRRYSSGLHQAIEAKEGIEVRKESQTLASITIQNYFRMYKKLSGMTGTAKTEEEEFMHIYNMDVVAIPTNKPVQRLDNSDVVYKNLLGKFKAMLDEIVQKNIIGQPVLVGTISIETSEFIGKLLQKRGIKHEVLNAKYHEREAEIIAQAGRLGAVTIATNMAGRGTDIKLGGNPEYLAKSELSKLGYEDHLIALADSNIEYNDDKIIELRKIYHNYYDKFKISTEEEAKKVLEAGGLHIIGTERHESRRIDNQLRGRSGRQGDPGSTKFYLSLEDDLLRLFMGENVTTMLDKLGFEEDMPIEAKILTKSIENAQKKVESRNFSARKHVLQYDDVLNTQREIIYKERNRVLEGENLKDHILSMTKDQIEALVMSHTSNSQFAEEWDIKGLFNELNNYFLPIDIELEKIEELDKNALIDKIYTKAVSYYEEKESIIGQERFREIERIMLLKSVDQLWMDHIDAMDQLKFGIALRAIGNEDPVKAYQKEGYDMFMQMIEDIKTETIKYMFSIQIEMNVKREKIMQETNQNFVTAETQTSKKNEKVGRNDLCPCGSGKKYKKCCGINEVN